MQLTTIFGLMATAATAVSAATTHKEYHLKSKVKPHQDASKSRFDGLYIQSYHTGAGLGDATLSTKNATAAAKLYLVPTNETLANGKVSNKALFDYGTSFPWTFVQSFGSNLYAGWEPVRINAGDGSGENIETVGFFTDANGLEWQNAPGAKDGEFGGWIACEWWHEVPQLFFRVGYYNDTLPCSCADIELCLEKA
nr:hypothetical protein CFP56_12021 [Quercus suber]